MVSDWRMAVRISSARFHVDHAGKPGGHTRAEQLGHRHFGEVRIGDVPVAQFPGELHCLDLDMHATGEIRCVPRESEMGHDIEGDQGGQTLAAGRDFKHFVAGEAGGDGLHPGRGRPAKSSSVSSDPMARTWPMMSAAIAPA